jgi:hypothetical protein
MRALNAKKAALTTPEKGGEPWRRPSQNAKCVKIKKATKELSMSAKEQAPRRIRRPAVALAFCLAKVIQAVDALPALRGVPRLWARRDEFARACGYEGLDANSAAKGLLAALSHFGLVETRLGQLRLRPELIEALSSKAARARLIVKAARTPALHRRAFDFLSSDPEASQTDLLAWLQAQGVGARASLGLEANLRRDFDLWKSAAARPRASEQALEIALPGGGSAALCSAQEFSDADWAAVEAFARARRSSLKASR